MTPMMKRAVGVLSLLVSFSVAGAWFKPSRLMADSRPSTPIGEMAKSPFGRWKPIEDEGQVVNPQANALLNRLYAETVNRRFEDDKGNVVMLAIAYGRDQSDALQVHEPMICYPSQGFAVDSLRSDGLQTPWGTIPIERMVARMGPKRIEPVTYWTTLGDRTVDRGAWAKKRIKFDYSLDGLIPDGLLFRVSSIDPDETHAFQVQDRFVQEYLASLPPQWRLRLSGL